MDNISILEYKAWMIRLGEEIDRPSRSDYYLMAVTRELRKLYNLKIRKSEGLSLEDFRLPVRKKDSPNDKAAYPKKDVKKISTKAKSSWGSLLSKPPPKK